MATAMTISRELPEGLPFYVGDILGSGAFATYISLDSIYVFINFTDCG